LASKGGRQLLSELFIYPKDIALTPGHLKTREIFKMTTVAPKPVMSSRIHIRGF